MIVHERIPPGFHLSHSSILRLNRDPISWYRRYILRHPDEPPTIQMEIGSAFDNRVKERLCEDLRIPHPYNFREKEASLSPESNTIGEALMRFYISCGGYNRLRSEMEQAVTVPVMEIQVQGYIEGVPVRGYPDLYYINGEGTYVITDWKCNSIRSTSASPDPGYIWDSLKGPASMTYSWKGLTIGGPLTNVTWAAQTLTYAICLGAPATFVAAVDQLTGYSTSKYRGPYRLAQHRGYIKPEMADAIRKNYVSAWARINSNHFFTELPLHESLALEEQLRNTQEIER